MKGTLVLPCLTSLDTAREVLRVVANRKNNAKLYCRSVTGF